MVKETKNHKRKTKQFALGLVQLLIQGIKVRLSYYGMKEWPTDHLVAEWETKMTKLKDTLETVSDDVKSNYLSQMKLETKDLLLRYHCLGNQILADKLYNFVTEKYDWRFWFVAVYDDMRSLDQHDMWQHCGTCNLHEHGKNTIIASQSKNHSSRFNKNNADKLLEIVENTVTSKSSNYECEKLPDRAYAFVNWMKSISRVVNNYLPHALRPALLDDHNLVYHSLESHRSVRNIYTQTTCCLRIGKCIRINWKYVIILFG